WGEGGRWRLAGWRVAGRNIEYRIRNHEGKRPATDLYFMIPYSIFCGSLEAVGWRRGAIND
ncbi:MAG: hypothetical protein H7831_18290, partial [Magnetococcus sp. WYHC-3]